MALGMRFGSIKLTRYNPVWLVIDPPSIYRESAARDVVCTWREKETHSTGHLHSGEERGRCGGVGGKRREGGVGVWGCGWEEERGRCGGVGGKREGERSGGGWEEGEREVWGCGQEERESV